MFTKGIPHDIDHLGQVDPQYGGVVTDVNQLPTGARFFVRNEAAEFLEEHGVDIRIVENFDGSVTYLDDNLQPRQTEWYTNGYLVLMPPDEKPNFFRAAYTGLGDIITEFQRKLARIGAFPNGFPYYDHLVRIKGTYQETE